MHLPERTPRPSIYFRYEVHSPWLPQPGQPPQAAPVVIVGAGPAGLVTALELARHGVASIVLESELQVSLGSRAIVFTRRSLEILQQVGVADQMTQMGLPWRFGNSYYRGERVFRMEAPHDEDDRFFPMLNIQQQYLEKFLVDACAAEPLIELRWGNRVVALQQDEVRARLTCDTPTGDYELVSDWVVACDGGRSPLRSLLGLKPTRDSSSLPTFASTCRIPPSGSPFSIRRGIPAIPCSCIANLTACGEWIISCHPGRHPSRPWSHTPSGRASTRRWR